MPVEGIETWDGFRGNVDANACRDLDPRSFAYGEPQSIADGACPGAHGLFREVACEQSEKLIPAEPSYDVGWAETGRNRAGRLLDDIRFRYCSMWETAVSLLNKPESMSREARSARVLSSRQ